MFHLSCPDMEYGVRPSSCIIYLHSTLTLEEDSKYWEGIMQWGVLTSGPLRLTVI